MMAKVYVKTVLNGEKWIPLQPKRFRKGKNFIDVEYHVPEPPLKLDTLTLLKSRNYGFEIRQGNVTKTITNVRIHSPTAIRLTVSSDFTAGDIEVNYAGPQRSGHGNVCDSDTFTSFEKYRDLIAAGETEKERNRFKPAYEPRDENGNIIYDKPYPLQNFSCAFYYLIPANKDQLICAIEKD
jgi:hypothetical protein